jgi:hypothetical protein
MCRLPTAGSAGNVWRFVFKKKNKVTAVRNDLYDFDGKYEVGGFWKRRDVADSTRADCCCDWKR